MTCGISVQYMNKDLSHHDPAVSESYMTRDSID